jgi:hypothetical protein
MTEDTINRREELDALENLLLRAGADRTRWPAPERLRFASLLVSDSEAQRLLREARALDRLLDLAPRPQRSEEAIARRIAAAASREKFGVRRPAPFVRSLARDAGWPAAALMAASLVLGAFAGTMGLLDPAFEPVSTASAGSSDTDADPSLIAFGGDETGIFGEDLL